MTYLLKGHTGSCVTKSLCGCRGTALTPGRSRGSCAQAAAVREKRSICDVLMGRPEGSLVRHLEGGLSSKGPAEVGSAALRAEHPCKGPEAGLCAALPGGRSVSVGGRQDPSQQGQRIPQGLTGMVRNLD